MRIADIAKLAIHSDLAIKEGQQIAQFLIPSHAFNYSSFITCHFIDFIHILSVSPYCFFFKSAYSVWPSPYRRILSMYPFIACKSFIQCQRHTEIWPEPYHNTSHKFCTERDLELNFYIQLLKGTQILSAL